MPGWGSPEVTVGLVAAAGGLLRLPQRVGVGRAALLPLTGTPVTGEEAHRIGLVDLLAEPGTSLEVALAVAETIGKKAPLALAATKRVIVGGFGRSAEDFWAW
jgi:enoyl-CoA hydratase